MAGIYYDTPVVMVIMACPRHGLTKHESQLEAGCCEWDSLGVRELTGRQLDEWTDREMNEWTNEGAANGNAINLLMSIENTRQMYPPPASRTTLETIGQNQTRLVD